MRRGFAAILLFQMVVSAHGQVPPRSISTPKEQVDDEFIAYLHGAIYANAELNIDGDTLKREFPEFVPTEPTPFNDIELLLRTHAGFGTRSLLSVRFSVPLRYEVPVDILGQRPVELQGSRTITFREIARPGLPASGIQVPDSISRFLVLVLDSGYMRVDFSPWLDVLAGPILDDVEVTLIAIARYEDRWFALLGGLNPDQRPMTGVFDMKKSRFLVSPPRVLTRITRDLVREVTEPAAR